MFGAVSYAHEPGFDPEADFDVAAAVLGVSAGVRPIHLSRDGKPFYVNGPYDDPEAVVRTLRRAVGGDGFDYVAALPEQPRRALFRVRR